MTESERSAQRSDAQHNRQHIIEVARDALAASPTASLNSIAKAAGVGAGTLYRHFPNREALVLEVYRHEIDDLVRSAPAMLAAHPPLEALRMWIERLARDIRIKHGFGEALNPAAHESVTRETYKPVIGAIEQLLAAGKKAGVVRADVGADELLLMLGFASRTEAGKAGDVKVRRMIGILVDGLRKAQ